MKSGFVYFVKPVGLKGPIKIGFSKHPTVRLSSLSAASPLALETLGIISATKDDEHFLHCCFPHQYSHGEWFHWSEDLQAAVSLTITGGIVAARASLNPTGKGRPWSRRPRPLETRRRQSASMRHVWDQRRQKRQVSSEISARQASSDS